MKNFSDELMETYKDLLEDIKEHRDSKADYNTFIIEKSIYINTNNGENQCFDNKCCDFIIAYNLTLECKLDDKGFSLNTALLRQWANEININSCELMLVDLRAKVYDYLLTRENIQLDTYKSYISISPLNLEKEKHQIKLMF